MGKPAFPGNEVPCFETSVLGGMSYLGSMDASQQNVMIVNAAPTVHVGRNLTCM